MHTLQWVVVEAEDEQTAAEVADSQLAELMGDGESPSSWYDWYVVGGGRWNVEEGEAMFSAYNTKTNMVISYDRDPNGFYGKLQELIANRVDTYNEYLAEVKEIDVLAKLDNYGGVMSYDPSWYALARLLDYQQGNWNYDSKFYDLTSWSTNASHTLAKISSHQAESPEKVLGIFLVPIDFHF